MVERTHELRSPPCSHGDTKRDCILIFNFIHVDYDEEHFQSKRNIARCIGGFCELKEGKRILRCEKQGMREGLDGRCVPGDEVL
jgi:hypothetical protein